MNSNTIESNYTDFLPNDTTVSSDIFIFWQTLFLGDDAEVILHILPPCQLHILLGIVNHILDSLDELGWPIVQWLKDNLGFEQEKYHGGKECCSKKPF